MPRKSKKTPQPPAAPPDSGAGLTPDERKLAVGLLNKEIKAIEVRTRPPRGEAALEPVQSDEVMTRVQIERAMEALNKLLKSLNTDEDITPMVLGKYKRQIMIVPLKVVKGRYVMPDMKPPSRLKLFHRARRVNRILKSISPILKRDIGDVAKVALMRKDDEYLKNMEEKLRSKKAGDKPVLRNRIGCIFVEFGDESFQI